MTDQHTISRAGKLLPSQDYKFLRQAGIKHIENLSHRIWTDYNVHDPGITTLELLCYAITDLGYRTSYEIKDILAADPQKVQNGTSPSEPEQFLTAAQIFPCNPLSPTDFRKLLIDLKGVKNAWLEVAHDYEKRLYVDADNNTLTYDQGIGNKPLQLNGLYNVRLEYEDEYNDDEKALAVDNQVKQAFHAHRNLCEDFYSIAKIEYEKIGVCADIEVTQDADINEVLAQIYHQISQYFSPQINFYTIDELLAKGKTVDQIFEGPLLEHGFIDDEELEKAELRRQLRVSDMINFIMDIKGVLAVKNLLLTSYKNEIPQQINQTWILNISDENHVAKFDPAKSKFLFFKGILPYIADEVRVAKRLDELDRLNRKYRLKGHQKDLPIPQGQFMEIEDYYPVQNEFPLVYGIGEVGLSKSASPRRQAQAKQLKAYLLFFEQLLADYLSQLANVKHLFAYNTSVSQTYFVQEISGIKDYETLYLDHARFAAEHYKNVEDQQLYEKRRNRFLDHLMGRFCEEITEYSLLMYALLGKTAPKKLIKDKTAFLTDYPRISSQRGKSFDYKKDTEVWDTDNVAGMKRRVSRLLGFENILRRDLACRKISVEPSGADYVIQLLDPQGGTQALMTSIPYPDRECAESILHYILSHGDNIENYKTTRDKTGKFWFSLENDCNEVIAASEPYASKEDRDADFKRVLEYFKTYCDTEGFYIVEHILLRPQKGSEGYHLLPVCVPKKAEPEPIKPHQGFRFEIYKDQPRAAGQKAEWRSRLRDQSGDIVLKSEGYKRRRSCTSNISLVTKYAADRNNYQLLRAKNGRYYFNIRATNREIVATSSDFYRARTDAEDQIKTLMEFAGYRPPADDAGEQLHCPDADPYSFRISVILPSWPEKFRDLNFRRFVERTIRMETPAHIFPRICYVNLQQMTEFEDAYRPWLHAIAQNDGPGKAVVNDLIYVLFNLKNVYPVAKLHDCEYAAGDDPQVILDYSTLGII